VHRRPQAESKQATPLLAAEPLPLMTSLRELHAALPASMPIWSLPAM
jgi:hypothetical protein